MSKPHKHAVLPCLDHITLDVAAKVYEPAEDTYLLCDALLCDLEDILSRRPQIILEVGCGSGCVITYLSTLLAQSKVVYRALATDINPIALETTRQTAEANQVSIELFQTDLLTAVEHTHAGLIDVMLFNPPYVPTPSEEIGKLPATCCWGCWG